MESPEKLSPASNGGLYELAAGLLWRDRIFLLKAYPLLVLPYLIELAGDETSVYTGLLFRAFERLAQLVFLYWVMHRWVAQLSLEKSIKWSRGLPKLLAFGFLVWIVLGVAIIVQLMSLGVQERTILLILSGPMLVFWFRYYFYFFPCVLGVRNDHTILSMARSFTARDPYLPWRTLIAPIAILSLISVLVTSISPDNRLITPSYFLRLFEGILWCLSTYISLAAALIYFPEKDWRESNLDPYREARLTTIALGAPSILSSFLSIKSGIKILGVSFLVWLGNSVQSQSIPPAPIILVDKIEIRGNSVDLTISLSDSEYRFRGFFPIVFELAGDGRVPISVAPPTVVDSQSRTDVSLRIPGDKDKITIVSTFKTNRSGESLKLLQDLHLWYGIHKIAHLKMGNATILPEAPVATPAIPPPPQ